jgi:hypothetical protein
VTEREKDAPRRERTHIFCYPGRCSKPVRLEETSNSRLASVCNISDANTKPISRQNTIGIRVPDPIMDP